MKHFMIKTKMMCLGVAVLVGGLGGTLPAEANTMGAIGGDQLNMSYLINRFDESQVRDTRHIFLGDGHGLDHMDSSDRTSGVGKFDTVYFLVRGSLGRMFVPVPEATTGGSSSPNPVITIPGVTKGLHEVGNSIKNEIATIFEDLIEGPVFDDGGARRDLPTKLGTLSLPWDKSYFDHSANTPGSSTLEGAPFRSNFFGHSPWTQLWLDHLVPGFNTLWLLGFGLVGLIRYRINRA